MTTTPAGPDRLDAHRRPGSSAAAAAHIDAARAHFPGAGSGGEGEEYLVDLLAARVREVPLGAGTPRNRTSAARGGSRRCRRPRGRGAGGAVGRRAGRAARRSPHRGPDDFAEDDFRRTGPRFQGEDFSRNLAVVDAVGRLAEATSVTPSQLALAWVLRRGAVPIPGTKRRTCLEENLAATGVTITDEDIAAIEAVAPRGVASGDRYAPEYMHTLNG